MTESEELDFKEPILSGLKIKGLQGAIYHPLCCRKTGVQFFPSRTTCTAFCRLIVFSSGSRIKSQQGHHTVCLQVLEILQRTVNSTRRDGDETPSDHPSEAGAHGTITDCFGPTPEASSEMSISARCGAVCRLGANVAVLCCTSQGCVNSLLCRDLLETTPEDTELVDLVSEQYSSESPMTMPEEDLISFQQEGPSDQQEGLGNQKETGATAELAYVESTCNASPSSTS